MAVAPDILVRLLMRERVKLLAFIGAIVGDRHLAEDVLQEVCARAIRKADAIDDESAVLPWARSAARLVAIEELRARRRRPLIMDEAVLDVIEARWGQIDGADTGELGEALDRCVQELSPYARRIIDTRYGRGLTGQQLADALGRRHGTVYVALSRIHDTLNKCVRRKLGTGPRPAGGGVDG